MALEGTGSGAELLTGRPALTAPPVESEESDDSESELDEDDEDDSSITFLDGFEGVFLILIGLVLVLVLPVLDDFLAVGGLMSDFLGLGSSSIGGSGK